jgi:tetratricopeptide (TPR) repeat protein
MSGGMDIPNLKKTLDKNPKSLLFARLADALRLMAGNDANLDEALVVANKGLEVNSEFLPGKLVRGRILLEKGDFTGAKIDFETVTQRDPFCLSAQKLLLETLAKLGQQPKTEINTRILRTFEPDVEVKADIQEVQDMSVGKELPKKEVGLALSENAKKTERASLFNALDSILDEEDDKETEIFNLLLQKIDKILARPMPVLAPKLDDIIKEQLADKGGVKVPDLTGDINSLLSAPATPSIDDIAKEQLADKGGVKVPDLTGDINSLLKENEILAQNPTPTLAELYISQGLPQKAVAVYKELLTRDPGNVELQAKLALAEAQV